jgi:hypothetical protein
LNVELTLSRAQAPCREPISGPSCFISAPEADYRIEGTYRGEMKFEIVQTGNMSAQIKW